MSRKVVVILVVLLVIIGLLGGYCFYLTKGIVTLTELQADTNRQISNMQTSIDSLGAKMTSLREETASQITDIEGKISTQSTQIEDMSARIEDIPPAIDAEGLYHQVKGSVVEIVTEAKGEKVSGSGFVFHSERFIVTAYHVVKGANKVNVTLHDGTICDVNKILYCPYSDVAVLKLEQAVAAEALTLGDSNAITIGEPVIAIGSPFQLSGTLTSGIISQKDRFISIDYDGGEHCAVANLIQCDASVNFGNSGGPLINAKGEVIGLVIARVDPLEGDGIYYAVSSNKLNRVAGSIIDRGSFDYPWLGVGLANLSPEEALSRQLDTISGTLVTEVMAGDPAARAGTRVDDIIIAIDDIPVRKAADLASYLGENKSPRDWITLTIIRDGGKLELSVQLAKRTS